VFVKEVAEVLPWLLWEDRERVFRRMIEIAGAPDQLQVTAQQMGSAPDSRFAPLLWELLARDEAGDVLADIVFDALKRLYFEDHYYEIDKATTSQRQAAIADALPKAKAGSRWQRTVALTLTMQIAFDDAAAVARGVIDDTGQDAKFRANVFQLLLMHEQSGKASKMALAGLKSDNENVRNVSLRFLAGDTGELSHLPGGRFSLMGPNWSRPTASAGPEVSLPEAPKGLSAEMLAPFAESSDPAVSANAAYLLALLNDGEKIDRLIDEWRRHPEDDNLQRLVYRAVAVLDDASRVPVLVTIYELLHKSQENTQIKELYWTIRTMSGPDALALRKRIRDEVGMDQLR
jgi:hypothetical protein